MTASHRSRPRRVAVSLAASVTILAAGCSAPPEERVPDTSIVDAIAELPGVTTSTVEFQNSFGYGARYSGSVEVASDADAMCVLYQTVGLLRQGRAGVQIGVHVEQDGQRLDQNDLVAGARLQQDLALPSPPGDEPVVLPCDGVPLDRPTWRSGSTGTASEPGT